MERRLQGEKAGQLLERMYGNDPDTWRDDLDGWDRVRFTINAFTRLRVCETESGRMVLKFKGPPDVGAAGHSALVSHPVAEVRPRAARVRPLVGVGLRQ